MRYVASVSTFNAFILSRRHRSHLDDGMIERMHVRVAPVALEFRLFSGRRKFRILPLENALRARSHERSFLTLNKLTNVEIPSVREITVILRNGYCKRILAGKERT